MSAEPGIWSERAGDPSAPALFLVHGSMDRSAGLLRLSRRLDRSFAVVRYDRRGYGRSLGVGPPHTVAANIDDLQTLVERYRPNDDPVHLFGHSFGGNIVLGLAARRPDLVACVAVYETPMSWLSTWTGQSARSADAPEQTPGDAAESFIRRLVGDEAWDKLPPSKQQQRRAEGEAMVGEFVDLRAAAPWMPDDVTVPVLTMYGEHGQPHHREAMLGIAEMVKDGRCVEVPGAGHPGPHTHADLVAGHLAAFIAAG